MVFSPIGTYLPPLVSAMGSSNNLYVMGASWTSLTNNSKDTLLLSGVGVFVRWSSALGGGIGNDFFQSAIISEDPVPSIPRKK